MFKAFACVTLDTSPLTDSSFLVNVAWHDANLTFPRLRKQIKHTYFSVYLKQNTLFFAVHICSSLLLHCNFLQFKNLFLNFFFYNNK